MPQQTVTAPVEREPAWPPTLTPYIVVSDARRAMDWYVEVFGAQRRGELHVNADGTIGHAEVGIGDAVLMFAEHSDLWPDVPVRAPDSPTTFSHTLHLEVADVDGTTERARRNGAAVERPPTDQPYGRGSVIVDPFGHRWTLLRPPARAGLARPTDPDRPPGRPRPTSRPAPADLPGRETKGRSWESRRMLSNPSGTQLRPATRPKWVTCADMPPTKANENAPRKLARLASRRARRKQNIPSSATAQVAIMPTVHAAVPGRMANSQVSG